nr:heavy metal translocating P-type ATPase [Desulforamulus reducens]
MQKTHADKQKEQCGCGCEGKRINPTRGFSMGKINYKSALTKDFALPSSPFITEEKADQKKTELRLSGLDCADCAAKLERKIQALPGVAEAKINFGAGKITVCHTTPAETILQAIKTAGYQGRLANEARKPPKQSVFEDTKLVLTGFSGLMVAVGFFLSFSNISETLVNGVYLAAILSGGFYTARSGLTSLKSVSLDMNFLMTVAVVGAVAIGEWAEGATVVFLFALGNTLQAFTMEKTRNSIRALMDLSPKDALVLRNGQELRLPVEELRIDDIIIVKPGECIPMDGEVVAGTTDVNQAPITGESMPIEKTVGHEVYAGTMNGHGAIEVKVTKLVEDTTLAKIINLVEEAQAQKAPSQQLVDVFAKYYTPAVVIGAVLIALVPWLFFAQPFQLWIERALILLVISCPCALVISTPVSIVAAIGSAARKGVLIKGGAYLEEAGSLKVIAFDKTGTLTRGRPEVAAVIPVDGVSSQRVIELAAAIEKRSQHPLAEAILRYAKEKEIKVPIGTEFQSFTGKGAAAIVDGMVCYIGNSRLFEELNLFPAPLQEQITVLQNQGKTVMILGSGHEVLGLIAVADQIRESSRAAVAGLRQAGISQLVMLTGDNTGTARIIAQELGIDDYRAELLPENKLKAIQQLQQEYGKVGMVGDGINDAPALATAAVGIAMGGAGTDTALETADIALMADDLSKLPYAMHLSKQTLRIIKQNIWFSLAIKAVFIAATFLGFANLWMAVFADTGAALLVIANGMRLMKVEDPYTRDSLDSRKLSSQTCTSV